MLLVDDNEAEVLDRSEQGAPGAHHNIKGPAPDIPPLVEPLAGGLPAVYQGDAACEPRVYALERLGGQGNLRHQVHGPPAQADGVSDGPEVHLGLAAAGYAVKQERTAGQVRRDVSGVRAKGCIEGAADFR